MSEPEKKVMPQLSSREIRDYYKYEMQMLKYKAWDSMDEKDKQTFGKYQALKDLFKPEYKQWAAFFLIGGAVFFSIATLFYWAIWGFPLVWGLGP